LKIYEEPQKRRRDAYAKDRREGRVYFTNTVTEIWLEENAQVSHTTV